MLITSRVSQLQRNNIHYHFMSGNKVIITSTKLYLPNFVWNPLYKADSHKVIIAVKLMFG